MIPIGVHQYIILSTMISSIPLGKQLGNEIIRYPMHATFSFHHSNLQLAYTTQAWIFKFKNLCHASKHMKCTFKCTIQVHELAPPTCVLTILIDPFSLSYFSPYVKYSPFVHYFLSSSTIFVH